MSPSIDIFIDRKVVVLKETDTVLKAAKAMCENQVGCIIISNTASKICGILTDRDIVCNLISVELDSETPLKKIMETDVVWLNETATVFQAVTLMKEQGIRRLPIVEESRKGHQKCVGVVTLDDLIAGEFVTNKDLSDIVKSQIIRKKKVFRKPVHDESRMVQTYSRFLSHLSKEIGLERAQAESVVKFILSSAVQRLHYTGGVHFISQLPKQLQEELLDLPAGPDRTITGKKVIQGISIRTGMDLKISALIAFRFWTTLCGLLGVGETDHVIHQLPGDMKALFVGPREAEFETLICTVTEETDMWNEER